MMTKSFPADTPKTLYPKIAVFRALRLGDLLCAVPALRALRHSFPASEISLIGLHEVAEAFVERFSYMIDRHIDFPGFPGLPEREPDLAAIPDFIKQMQDEKFDLFLQMQGDGTIVNPLVTLFQARKTAGFFLQDSFAPNTDFFIPYPHTLHEIHRLLKLVLHMGAEARGDSLEFPLSKEEKEARDDLLRYFAITPKQYVCIHPGSRSIERRWPLNHFTRVADTIAKQGYTIVLTGSKDEEDICKTLAESLSYESINLAGKTNLGILAGLIEQSALLIANDTSVSHIASALEVPSVIVFLSSEVARWRPLQRELHKVVNGNTEWSVDDVIKHAYALLSAVQPYHFHQLH